MRFTPAANFLGQVATGLTSALGLDLGNNRRNADVSLNGGATAYSNASDTISVAVVSPYFQISGSTLTVNAASTAGSMTVQFSSPTALRYSRDRNLSRRYATVNTIRSTSLEVPASIR